MPGLFGLLGEAGQSLKVSLLGMRDLGLTSSVLTSSVPSWWENPQG